MHEKDTCELLKECNVGIKMAVDALGEVLPDVKDSRMEEILSKNKTEHERLGDETHALLLEQGETTEEPGMIAKGMSWLKTNVKLKTDPGDDTIANLISTGSDMGVRNLNKYLNQFSHATDHAKDLVRQVIRLEEKLSSDMKAYL